MEEDNNNNANNNNNTAATHRKRLAQILRYIASMHQTLNGDGGRHSFVRVEDYDNDDDEPEDVAVAVPRGRRGTNRGGGGVNRGTGGGGGPLLPPLPPPSDFFQLEAGGGPDADGNSSSSGGILFTANDFSQLLALEQRASAISASSTPAPLFDRPLFSFYAASSGSVPRGSSGASSSAAAAARNKRTLTGALKSTFAAASAASKKTAPDSPSSSSLNGKPCWLRITRLTNAQIATKRPSLVHLHPAVRQYLEEWRTSINVFARDDDDVEIQSLQELLTLRRLATAPPVVMSPHRDARAAAEIRSFLRRYKKYLYKREYQQRLEPLYNRLFEWVQQRDHLNQGGAANSAYEQPEELVFGLGHARLQQTSLDSNGNAVTTWINGPVLEVLVEVELARDGALLVRPRDHTGVALNRQVVTALSTASGSNNNGGNAAAMMEDDGSTIASFASQNTSSSSSATGALAQLYRTVGELEASQLSPGQPTTYIPLLKRMAMELSSTGAYQALSSSPTSAAAAAAGRSTAADRKLRITEAWCLYTRPKPSSVWARDAMAFADQLMMKSPPPNAGGGASNSCTPAARLPRAAWSLTHGPGVFDSQSLAAASNSAATVTSKMYDGLLSWLKPASSQPQQQTTKTVIEKPLFPLPTSDPQNQIAELLLGKKAPAVVLEGPPGTGKTHTIANIICAYLCQGKRVLVTSKNAPALSVVRNRLPKSIQDLCVDVSMSELSGMRQLQQTVERLANRVSCAGTSGDLQAEKCSFLRTQIKQLEQEIAGVDDKLLEHSTRVGNLLRQKDGKQLVALSLELIEAAPWLMRLTPTWTVDELVRVRDELGSIVLEDYDPVFDVTGFENNNAVDDALISKVASNAGQVVSIFSNVAKTALASVPVLGEVSGLSEQAVTVQDRVDRLRIRGSPPTTKDDWKVVLRALKRAHALASFETTVWKPQQYKNAWPVFPSNANAEMRPIHEIFCKAVDWKELTVELDLPDEIESAIESRSLDVHRGVLSSQIQRLAEDLVDATVVMELSRSFSTEAQSALIRFSQIAGRAKFGRSSSSVQSKMTQRQKRRRQEYLDAFDKCCRFIPCWILTSSQISDYLPAECLFDLVIIDEASQSDVTVLPGMLRGTQWLTVGDSKQVSPTESFIAEEQIESLRASLPPSPLEDSLMPGHSFFDLCAQAFPQGRVVLSEHFRCAEEIIDFSNEQFYDGRLVPLRLPTKSERLTPSIVDVKVEGAKTGKTNPTEANKIVEMIQELVGQDPAAAVAVDSNPRTIGIISLIGDEQARLIRGRLLDVIGPHMMARHEILVGTPPSFQGAERDVIFLSMVASPGAVPTQNQVMYVQRANVAMSRARDRCVLVRSIDPHHIANQEDIKLPVIEFFQTASAAAAENGDENARAIESEPADGKGLGSSAIDSLIQKLLKQRGFIVRSMGVVWKNGICVEHESEDRRAALIVDSAGESSSSVQEWLSSYAQQKAIQRVGWKCMRVDALSLVADFNGTMQSVMKFLAAAGIEERPILYDQLDDEEDEQEAAEEQSEEMQLNDGDDGEEAVQADEVEVENLDGDEPEGMRLDDQNPDGDDQAAAVAVGADADQSQEIVIISSEDDSDDRKMPPPGLPSDPQPDAVASGGPFADLEENNPGDFGQVVQLGFLQHRGMDGDPTEMEYAQLPPQLEQRQQRNRARNNARNAGDEDEGDDDDDDSHYSDAYQGDLSDMGEARSADADDEGTETASKKRSRRRRRLDQYARDPRWYPNRDDIRQEETKEAHEDQDLYDTDSDLHDAGNKNENNNAKAGDQMKNGRRVARGSFDNDDDEEEYEEA